LFFPIARGSNPAGSNFWALFFVKKYDNAEKAYPRIECKFYLQNKGKPLRHYKHLQYRWTAQYMEIHHLE